jgi:aminopeptidase N
MKVLHEKIRPLWPDLLIGYYSRPPPAWQAVTIKYVKSVKRLYTEFKPERYELSLEPDRESKTFSGRVIISGQKTGRPSQRLTLHQKDLKIKSAKLSRIDKKSGSQPIDISRHNTQKSYDELRLHAGQMLYPGHYVIELEFSGKITEPMHGIYPCNFELGGQKKHLIATQFESHHAREAFPCIDEPEAKAVFSLSLKTPAGETVISNTPAKTQKKSANQLVTTFEDTPKMSTYLLAFVYGELAHKSAKSKNGVEIGIYSTPDKIALTDFGLDVAVKALDFYEEYFGVPYPLPKLDIIGLPDFSAGAMENWGLVTFRESVLYVDPKSSGIDTKQFVCMVVAHELAHQWFGNLVTMRWWNDLWLNESFANLMEYRATDELFPEWKIWEEFTAREMGQALSRDSLPNVQAVRTDVHHPDELSSVFDPAIVYAKGGCLLNMVRNLIGEAAFKKGLKSYFEQFKYKNTEADDLWDHLAKASGTDIGELMQTWLNKPGFPVLEVKYKPGGTDVEIAQNRLVVGKTESPSRTIWRIPLSASGDTQPMLETKSANISIKPKPNYPLVFNQGGRSYFVSQYVNDKHFSQILKSASLGQLDPIDRLLLVQSYLLLERAGKTSTVDNLQVFKALSTDREEAVWSVMASIIAGVRTLIGKDEAAEENLNNQLRPAVESLVRELGWGGQPDDSSHTQKLRALSISLGAAAKHQAIIDEGLKRFKAFKKPADLPPDIRQAVYFIGVRYGSETDFDKLVKLYTTLNSAEEKDEVAAELTATRQPELIERCLQMITGPNVRAQDVPTWFAWLMRNRYATEPTWRWLGDNWKWVESKYSTDKSYDRFPRYAAMAFSYPQQLVDYKRFFVPKSDIGLERAIKLGIEEIEGRIEWRQKNEQAVKDWLANN